MAPVPPHRADCIPGMLLRQQDILLGKSLGHFAKVKIHHRPTPKVTTETCDCRVGKDFYEKTAVTQKVGPGVGG